MTPTGYFGTLTERAVKRFQRDMHIQVDGVVGPETSLLLFTRLAGEGIPRLKVVSSELVADQSTISPSAAQ